MLHRDLCRSGYVKQMPPGPYERKWHRDFHLEMIATRVEAIVAEGLVFVGTYAGNFYALDAATGGTRWRLSAGGPFCASPAYDEGVVYVGCHDGFVYALKAKTGAELWRFGARAGFVVAPAVAGALVLIGSKEGTFYAIDKRTGKLRWSRRVGGMILQPASVAGGKVVFGAEDMRVRCLELATGRLIWETEKLWGLSLRDYAPTIWRGLAIVRTNPSAAFHEVLNRDQQMMLGLHGIRLEHWKNLLKPDPRDPENNLRKGYGFLKPTPELVRREQEAIVRYLKEHPEDKTFYAFDLATGKEPWTAPIFYVGGLHNPATPPTFNPHTGELYTFFRSAMTNYDMAGEVRPFTNLGKLDRNTGRITPLPHAHGEKMYWGGFAWIGDETAALSLAGDKLLCTHQGTVGYLDLKTRRFTDVAGRRDTYGGIFGPALVGGFKAAREAHARGELVYMPNEWHGPARGIVSIAYGRLYWISGSQVICIGTKG